MGREGDSRKAVRSKRKRKDGRIQEEAREIMRKEQGKGREKKGRRRGRWYGRRKRKERRR